jgi:NAD+ synthase
MIKDIDGLINKVIEEIKNFTDIAVVGLSGGADSTLVAILCMKALGKENVHGLHMPYNSLDIISFNKRSKLFASKIGIENYEIPIGIIADSIDESVTHICGGELSKVNKGNSRARARMCVLYNYAHETETDFEKRVRVMNTCNLSESFLGYETKFGDGAGDLAPIGNLFKSEIYQLLDYFRDQGLITEDMIDRVPSAGLWVDQRDIDELGYSYDELEPFMRMILKYHKSSITEDKIFKFVYEKYRQSEHKRQVSPTTIDVRTFCD